jgi:exopolysaccharide biosynthesis polyprenyl glycosylphosphotransferase
MLAPEANGSGEHVSELPAPSEEPPISVRPLENLGSAGSYSLRTRLLAFDLFASGIAWLTVGFFLTPSGGMIERLTRGSLAVVATLIALRATGLYRSRVCSKWSQEVERMIFASLFGSFAFISVGWSYHRPSVPTALLCGAICAVSTALLRSHYRHWLSAQRARGAYLRNVMLVGGDEDATQLWRMLSSEPELGYRVVAIIGEGSAGRHWDHLLTSTSVGDIPDLARACKATGVLIASSALRGKELQQAIDHSMSCGLHVQVWPGINRVGSSRLREVPISGEPFYYVEPHRVRPWQRRTKRVIDIVGASVGLILSSPVLLLIAAAIKIEGGPVILRQRRIGLNGAVIAVYKLRTMAVGSEEIQDQAAPNERTDGPLYKNSNDPRVTKVGRLLRPLSIDELPQLWNVLRGSMSLVGPRPALPYEVMQFDTDLQRRHTMAPGITGLWQCRARENPSFNAYRRFDLQYVDNWTLRLDLSILAATVPTVIGQAIRAVMSSHAKRRHPAATSQAALRPLANFPNIGDDRLDVFDDNPVKRELDPA